MIVLVRHIKEVKNWNHAWIYFGTNYLELSKFEKKVSGKMISLSDEIHKQSKLQRNEYLRWVEGHRKKNNDSLTWWMTQLAGRNSSTTNFYLYICQLLSIKKELKNLNDEKILIICENSFLQKFAYKNLKNTFSIDINFKININYFIDFLKVFLKGISSNVSQIIKFFNHRHYALKTKPVNQEPVVNDILLFHQCLDDKCFKGNKVIGRYFGRLPLDFKKKGHNIFQLAWLNNIKKPLPEVYRQLRLNDFLVADDWLSLRDYFWSILMSITTPYKIKFDKKFDSIDVNYLIQFEKLNILGSNSSRFWRYIPMMRNFIKKNKINSITYYDHYENIFFEHPIRYILKKLPIKYLSIGFYHTLHSDNFLGVHHHPDEWKSDLKPDKIVCFGELSKNILIKNGTPENIIYPGVGIRQTLPKELKEFRSEGDLVIPLALSIDYSVELLNIIININQWLIDNKINVKIKPHPSMRMKTLSQSLDNEFPLNWIWEEGDINDAFKNGLCCIGMATGSVFDAIINGCYVIPIKSQLLQMDNYLDIFEEDHPLMSAVNPSQLLSRLDKIYFNRDEDTLLQHKKVQKKLYLGINQVNSKNISDFDPIITNNL